MAIGDGTFILRSLSGRMFSTVVTALTVAVAVGLMLVLLGMRSAAERSFNRGAGDMHVLISAENSGLSSVLNGVFYAAPPRRAMELRRLAGIEGAHPWDYFIPTVLGDTYRGLPVVGTTRAMLERFRPTGAGPFKVARGRVFESAFEVVAGWEAAGLAGLSVGDVINLTHGNPRTGGAAHVHGEFDYTVVGVLERTGTPHDRAIFGTLEAAWVLHAYDRRGASVSGPLDLVEEDRVVTGVYARLLTRPGIATPANLPAVYTQLRADPSITVAQPGEEIRRLFAIVGNIDALFVGMAGVVLASSGVGIMLNLMNTMGQRRRQIALLRVLGASRGRVFGLVVTESAALGLIGAVLGVGAAVVGAEVVSGVLYQRLGLIVEPRFEAGAVVGVVLGTVGLAAAAGLIPAVSAYRTGVIRNLRPLG